MTQKFDDTVYKLVLSHSLASPEELQRVRTEAQETGISLENALVKNKVVREQDIMRLLADEVHLDYQDLRTAKVDHAVIEAVPYRFVSHYKCCPLKIENNILTIAVAFPLEIKQQDELRLHLGFDIFMVLASEKDISETQAKLYGLGTDTIERMLSGSPGSAPEEEKPSIDEVQDIERLAEDASIIRLVNQIILEAYKKRATDIHIEPYRNEIKLRYRIDGVLWDAHVSPHIKRFILPILSRIKIMSDLNIIERRLPQDGRAIVKTQEQVLDLRVSVIPTPYGESIVIRILPTSMVFDLEKVGLSISDQEIVTRLIKKPNGIVLVTGPTGSGKTTTLYACLSNMNKIQNKIVTIEDPVEYELPGIVQIQVVPDIGLTFARGLRSMLRHDPDCMMVGEIRDLETAQIAVRAALTGHLVLSTLHTNDAPSGITRLVDIGVEPYLVASSVEAFIAQRLVRTICPFCKREEQKQNAKAKMQIAKEMNLESWESLQLFRGAGCTECNFSGFRGRIALFEILTLNDALRDDITKKASARVLKKAARTSGMRTLRQDGWQKVIEGMTTPEEILRVTPDDLADELDTFLVSPKPTAPMPQPAAPAEERPKAAPAAEPVTKNKRLFARLEDRIAIQWKEIRVDKKGQLQSASEFLTKTKNISAGGLLFESNAPVAIGMVLELSIDLPNTSPITCHVKVVRVEEMEPEKLYYVAVCFLDLSGADRARLNNHVIENL